jgi:uncharacterized membrane protein YeaQ/YmgE (transglycosylase-associated protein family)
MSILLSLLVGALVGWLASLIMKTDAQQGALGNVAVGVVGSVFGNWVFGLDLVDRRGSADLLGLVCAVAGACCFIAALKFLRVLR